MRQALLYAAAILAVEPASAQSLTGFLGSSNLKPLAQSPNVLDLAAQSSTHTPQANINAFDQFFLINGTGERVVEFDKHLGNHGQMAIPRWVGVKPYSNDEIWFDLVLGLEQIRIYYSIPSAKAASVVVFKTVNTDRLMYDYVIQQSPDSQVCQEYLFAPATFDKQTGLRTACFWTLQQFEPPLTLSAGHQ